MTTNFDSIQTLKSREVCDKFSKSVSYETLVGGTTTTGTGYKQIRRLFLSSAVKPLTAVGTLTSLLCNSAKVKEKLLHRHSEPKAKNPKKTGTVIIGRGCEPIISAESKRDPRLIAMQSPRMTEKALSFLRLRGAGKKQKESSLILRKAKFQAIFKFVLSSASGGAGGGKYNRISAFVSMLVLLIRRSREFFNSLASYARDSLIFATQKRNDGNMKNRDDSFSLLASPKDSLHRHSEQSEGSIKNNIKYWILRFANAPFRMTIPALAFLLSLNLSESWAVTCNFTSDPNNAGKYNLEVKGDSGGNVFSGCDNGFPDDISEWSDVSSKITSATLDKNITSIGNNAFKGASSLTSITIPDSVKSIGNFAFSGASSLESITIPDSVTSIGEDAFSYAKSLTSITIPEGVTSIGNGAFFNASSLESIIIPDNIDTKNWYSDLPANAKIVCQGDLNTCYEKLAKYIPESKGGTCTEYCINNEIKPALFDSCKSTNYFWDGSTCIREPDVTKRKCCTSCKDMGGWCNRIQYTPAEAAKVLTNDNNNSVTITFKK